MVGPVDARDHCATTIEAPLHAELKARLQCPESEICCASKAMPRPVRKA
jgi:hypothetical protein